MAMLESMISECLRTYQNGCIQSEHCWIKCFTWCLWILFLMLG